MLTDDIYKKWAECMLSQVEPSFKFHLSPHKNWNWFERTFCKNIIIWVEYLEVYVPSKFVHWNNWSGTATEASMKEKEAEKDETIFHQPNNRSTQSKRNRTKNRTSNRA